MGSACWGSAGRRRPTRRRCVINSYFTEPLLRHSPDHVLLVRNSSAVFAGVHILASRTDPSASLEARLTRPMTMKTTWIPVVLGFPRSARAQAECSRDRENMSTLICLPAGGEPFSRLGYPSWHNMVERASMRFEACNCEMCKLRRIIT